MSGRCVGLRAIFGCWVLGLEMCLAAAAQAQPTVGFPPDGPAAPPPPPAEPPPPPLPPVAPAAADLQAPAEPSPVAPQPDDPLASRHPALPDYGSGLPPGPALAVPGLPAVLPHRPGFPIPEGYHAESRTSTGLVITGSLTFGLAYVTALGIAFSEKFENGAGWLAVPLIGPWGAIGKRSYKCPATAMDVAAARRCFNDAYDEATAIAVLAGDGVIQTFGVALFIAGLASQTHELVRDDVKPVKLTAAPRADGGFDFALRGRF